MIPAIGLMVGAYIFTRMTEKLMGDSKAGQLFVRVLALGTMVITVLCVLVLLFSGVTLPAGVR